MLFAVAAGEFACFSARCVVELVIYSMRVVVVTSNITATEMPPIRKPRMTANTAISMGRPRNVHGIGRLRRG
jgi:hypothetical protein